MIALITPAGAGPHRGETGPCSLRYTLAYAFCSLTFVELHCAHVVLSVTAPAVGPSAVSTKAATDTAHTAATASAAALWEAIRPGRVHCAPSAAVGVADGLVGLR